MNNTKPKLAEVALSALFVAIICVLAQIIIPTPWGVPFTLQIFAVCLCGYLLGVKIAVSSVGAYILLGLIGLPVFSGFKGGIHSLLGITGGFIFGFLAVAFFCGVAKNVKQKYLKILFSAVGIILCHIIGVLQLSLVSKAGFFESFVTASLPFILKDILLIFAAYFVAKILEKRLKF